MAIQLFKEEEDISLKEYSEDPNYEDYAGIVLDKDKNLFKVITGKFKDKKDFYDKMANRGLILRKCFEIRVYNWIKENAKTTLDAYLMLSTAFSKWEGNNMLNSYYNKLLNDIPALNREGQKGNPNTRGKKNEAVLTEMDLNIDELPYNLKVEWLFKNTPLKNSYIKALETEDPIKSADLLIKAWLDDKANEITKASINGNFTKLSKDFMVSQKKDNIKDLSIPKNNKNDIFNMYNIAQKQKDAGEFEYEVTIVPVLGIEEEQQTTQGKIIKVLHPTQDLTEKKVVMKVTLPGYGEQYNLKNELNNPYIKSTIWSNYYNAYKYLNKTNNKEKVIGVKIKVFEPNSHTNVTNKLNISATKDETNLQTIIDNNGNTKKILPAGAGFIPGETVSEDAFFLDRSLLRSWHKDVTTHLLFNGEKPETELNKLNKYGADSIRWLANTTINEIANKKKYLDNTDLDKNSEEALLYNKYKEQLNFLKQKKIDISGISYKNSYLATEEKTIGVIKEGAIIVLKNIEVLVTDVFNKNFMHYTSAGKKLENKLVQLDKDENISRILSSTTNISNKDQGAAMLDYFTKNNRVDRNNFKELTSEDLVFLANNPELDKKVRVLLAARKKGNKLVINNKTKKATIKADTQKELTKAEKLLNIIRQLTNELKSLQTRANQAQGKDQEVNNRIVNVKERLKDAQAKYNEYIKNQTNGVEEAYVNNGASSYYHDQQNAAKNALTGEFITEEITHSELNPALFNNDILKPDVLDAFLEIADKFKQTLNININPVDVYFTGSNANYNYNENSDIDIHLVYDFEQVGIAAEILEKYLRNAKRLFNLDYDEIKVKGIKVEVGYENTATPLVATAVYSLRNNNWIKKPDMKAIQIQDPNVEAYNDITSRIENAIQNKDLNTLESLWKEIGNLRKQSLNLEGEFGQGNALFKKLRNLGAIGRLRDAYYRAASKDLSLESNGDTINE